MVGRLSTEKEELSTELATLNSEIDQVKEMKADLELKLAENSGIGPELLQKLEAHENAIKEHEETHEHLTGKLLKRERQISELEDNHEHCVQKLYKREKQIDELETQLEELKKKISSGSSKDSNTQILYLVDLLKQQAKRGEELLQQLKDEMDGTAAAKREKTS